MNCDRIAPFYQWIERLAFGRRLERHRAAFINAAEGATTALVLGDGDGRFLSALTAAYPSLAIDCIELSAGMLKLAKQRARAFFLQGDALSVPFPRTHYDVVYSHFFLDCFTTDQVFTLARKISKVSELWVISDFSQLQHGWRKAFAAVWLKTMYLFFRLATQLETQHLPDYEHALREQGFHLLEEHRSMAGFVTSQRWQHPESHSGLGRLKSSPGA